MSKFISVLLFSFGALLCSCNDPQIKKKQNKEDAFKTLVDIDERLRSADSLVVVFYKHPYGADSLRYTRYYTQISVVGPVELELLQQQLKQKAIRLEKHRYCRGEGKVWCYSKGKIFQTLYFSTLCDNCCHVYLIKDGFFFYTDILKSFTSWLTSVKPISKEPFNDSTITNN
ncbi:MAG: hypothetical protein H7122_04785 [Chitinophagaceae bacterium]|nr:hypothetical protein [Chitinophagaceae bacterium]